MDIREMTRKEDIMDKIFILQGAAGCGKTTFIEKHGLQDMVISTDAIRHMINPAPQVYDETTHGMVEGYDFSGRTSARAFDIAETICEQRMQRGETIIIDSVAASRKTIGAFIHQAQRYAYAVYYVDMQHGLDVDEVVRRNNSRGNRAVPEDVVRSMFDRCNAYHVGSSERKITKEEMLGYRFIKEENLDAYDKVSIVGDIQGCFGAFHRSGHDDVESNEYVIFAGDLFDRGPDEEASMMFDWLVEHHGDNNKKFVIGNHDSYIRFYGEPEIKLYGRATATTIRCIMKDSENVHGSVKKLHRAAKMIYRDMVPVYAFCYHGKHYVVTHGGMHPSIIDESKVDGGYNMGFISDQNFYYGSGQTVNTGDYSIDIDDIIEHERRDDSPIQIHGHRNEHHHDVHDFKYVYNLETQVEHGGVLSVVDIDAEGLAVNQY
jgi:predicted kinase